jgi:Transposase DDE domain
LLTAVISQRHSLQQVFLAQGVRLITTLRTNMRNRLKDLSDKLLLHKWVLIETFHDQLKYVSQIERARHRSPYTFLARVLPGLIAYCHQRKRPSLPLDIHLLAAA